MGGAELRVKSVVWTKSGIPRSNEKCLGSYEVDKEWRRSINEKVVGLGRDRRGMEGLIEAESAIVVMTQNSGNSGMGWSKVMQVQRQTLGTGAQIPTGYMVKTLRAQSTCDSNMPSD